MHYQQVEIVLDNDNRFWLARSGNVLRLSRSECTTWLAQTGFMTFSEAAIAANGLCGNAVSDLVTIGEIAQERHRILHTLTDSNGIHYDLASHVDCGEILGASFEYIGTHAMLVQPTRLDELPPLPPFVLTYSGAVRPQADRDIPPDELNLMRWLSAEAASNNGYVSRYIASDIAKQRERMCAELLCCFSRVKLIQ